MGQANIITAHTLNDLIDHINLCLTERTPQALYKSLSWAQNQVGFHHAIMCAIKREDSNHFEFTNIINHSYEQPWINTYLTECYSDTDPIIRYSFMQTGTFPWEQAFVHAKTLPKGFLEAAADYGLTSGYAGSFIANKACAPRQRTLCSFSNIPQKQNMSAAYIMQALLPALDIALNNSETPKEGQETFSDKEREILKWASQGKSLWEIGIILAVSESTVKFHIQNIYRKLEVNNRAHAISKALQMKLI